MLTDLIEIAVAVGGAGLVALAIKQARAKGWSGSLQMTAAGFLLMGASAIGVVGFLASLVLNPLAWLGIIALGIAGVLFAIGQRLEGRDRKAIEGGESKPQGTSQSGSQSGAQSGSRGEVESGKDKAGSGVDADMAEIEEILRRRGIE
ncbi:MAG: hypothetical protein ACOCUN_00250 [Jiangellaceae bacterium]